MKIKKVIPSLNIKTEAEEVIRKSFVEMSIRETDNKDEM